DRRQEWKVDHDVSHQLSAGPCRRGTGNTAERREQIGAKIDGGHARERQDDHHPRRSSPAPQRKWRLPPAINRARRDQTAAGIHIAARMNPCERTSPTETCRARITPAMIVVPTSTTTT